MTRKILATGGAGFIGTNLVHGLRSRGHDVLAADLMDFSKGVRDLKHNPLVRPEEGISGPFHG